jgi:hypothetical protein
LIAAWVIKTAATLYVGGTTHVLAVLWFPGNHWHSCKETVPLDLTASGHRTPCAASIGCRTFATIGGSKPFMRRMIFNACILQQAAAASSSNFRVGSQLGAQSATPAIFFFFFFFFFVV